MYEETGSQAFGKLILRLTVGILMLFHGVAKLLNPDAVAGIGKGIYVFLAPYLGFTLEGGAPPEVIPPEAAYVTYLAYGVYLGEVLAPILIILGLFARFGGALIAINMIVAILLVHTGDLFLLSDSGGWKLELQGMFLFGGLAIAYLGSGKFAVRPD
jgi:putative oxidoreductase